MAYIASNCLRMCFSGEVESLRDVLKLLESVSLHAHSLIAVTPDSSIRCLRASATDENSGFPAK